MGSRSRLISWYIIAVRFIGDRIQKFECITLKLNSKKTAFLLMNVRAIALPPVTCPSNHTLQQYCSPAVPTGVIPVYLYNEP